jgi:hypothetical protein
MKLQNMIMQLRKVSHFCLKQASDIAIESQFSAQISSHPFLFDWPRDQDTGDLIVDDNLVNASGKMLLLQRLLDALFERGHKVLIFSQFTTMLDVIVRHSRSSSARSKLITISVAFTGRLGQYLQGEFRIAVSSRESWLMCKPDHRTGRLSESMVPRNSLIDWSKWRSLIMPGTLPMLASSSFCLPGLGVWESIWSLPTP